MIGVCKMKSLNILTIIAFAILFSGCVDSNAISETNLESGTWFLATYNGSETLDGHQPTLRFEAGRVSGNTGCNHYDGNYQVNGDTLSIDSLSYPEMACLETEGVMEQERIYLELLGYAKRYELENSKLTIFTDSQQTLVFVTQQDATAPTVISTLKPLIPTPSLLPISDSPAGSKEYQDAVVAVSLYIPENWTVANVIAGRSAVFQSYPADKYVGGEMLKAGDTKCDLNIYPSGIHAADLVQQWQSDAMTTIVSEGEFNLQSGLKGRRFVIDSMGRSTAFIIEFDQRVVLLTCFGDFTPVDAIATTIKANE